MATHKPRVNIVIQGRPVPKKNSPRIIPRKGGNRPILLPSKAWMTYEKDALQQLMAWGNLYFPGPVYVHAVYYPKDYRWWPDLVGLLQGTSDLLEKAGIIVNDKNIVSYGGSHIKAVDRDNPRVEIAIAEVEKPEWWREE